MHLQKFAIFNMSNLSLSYTLALGTLLYSMFFFSPAHLASHPEKTDVNPSTRVYIYTPKACFSQVAKNCQVFCQTVGGVFLAFFP
jgi:hypothetical protein